MTGVYQALKRERNELAAEMSAARLRDDGLSDTRFDEGYLAGLDRAIDVLVRQHGTAY